jgi:transposase
MAAKRVGSKSRAKSPARAAAAKRGRGQPTKLTPEIEAKVVEALRAGNWARIAAQYAGISQRTFHNWMEWGEAGREPYVRFLESVRQAESATEIRAVAIIQSAMPKDWKAAMSFLERRFSDRWGRRERITHEGGESPIALAIKASSDAERRAAAAAALAAARQALRADGMGDGAGD